MLGELVLVHARRGTGPVGGKVVLAVEELHGLPHVVVVEASGFESEFVPGHRVFVVVYGSHTHVERGSVGELEFVVEEAGAARPRGRGDEKITNFWTSFWTTFWTKLISSDWFSENAHFARSNRCEARQKPVYTRDLAANNTQSCFVSFFVRHFFLSSTSRGPWTLFCGPSPQTG